VKDLRIARRCGWRYDWVTALDPDVYAVLLAELVDEQTPIEG